MRELRAYVEGEAPHSDDYGNYCRLNVLMKCSDLPEPMRNARRYCLVGESVMKREPGMYPEPGHPAVYSVWDGTELVVWGPTYQEVVECFMRFNTRGMPPYESDIKAFTACG